ncbi:MAG TPA: pyridoxamine 5'-phosphate oxidase family protein [Nitrososphaera sp.]|nr:pyridoxamine 5'-phosphate oxidase family protein [Nitrososphaera sp.]
MPSPNDLRGLGRSTRKRSKRPKFSQSEKRFLLQNELCRIATSYKDDPHVVPVSYIFDKNRIFIAIGYGDKKYKNLKRNSKTALVVDVYKSSVDNKAIMVTGEAEFVTTKAEFDRLYKIFSKKFEWYKLHPWNRHEGTFVRIRPKLKQSWGIVGDQKNI